MTRTSVFASCIAVHMFVLGSCLRIETLVVEQQPPSVVATPSVVFDGPLPHIPASLPVYTMKPAPPKDSGIRNLIKERCLETCTADDSSSWTPPAACKVLMDPPKQPLIRQVAAASLSTSQTHATQVPADAPVPKDGRAYCQLGDDFSIRIFPRLSSGSRPAPMRPESSQESLVFARDFLERAMDSGRKVKPDYLIGKGRLLTQTLLKRDPKKDLTGAERSLPAGLFASAQRRVLDHYRVDGPGSRFSVMMAGLPEPEGLVLNWKDPVFAEPLRPVWDAPKLQSEIRRRLLRLRAGSRAHVSNIELVYYDAGKDLLQPAFRFVAEFSAQRNSLGHTEHVVGYVPYGQTSEAIGELDLDTELRTDEEKPPPLATVTPGTLLSEAAVGIYVVRADKKGWYGNGLAFAYGLESSLLRDKLRQVQFLDALPEQFTTKYQEFVNSVDIALVEAHGMPGVFATLSNNQALVRLGNTDHGFPTSGYGPQADGRLRHWAIHSCDVLAHPENVPWHEVFKGGLHTVVGYRSPMYVTDGATAVFGDYVGSGAPVIAAWFAAVASLNAYQLDPTTHLRCGGEEPMGLPAAISACGAADATVLDYVSTQPDCLELWKTGDALDR